MTPREIELQSIVKNFGMNFLLVTVNNIPGEEEGNLYHPSLF